MKASVHQKPILVRRVKSKSEDGNERKLTKPGFCGKKFIEFCKRTDLHGYKYIVMQDLSIAERCCWAVAVVVSVVFAVYFVLTAYNWYARNPIVTVIESTHGAIWDVPFPAVTICDLNLISRKQARELADEVRLPATTSRDDFFEMLRAAPLLLTNYKTTDYQKVILNHLQEIVELNNISIFTLFKRMSPAASCSDLVERCMWKNTIYRCELLFRQIFTQFSVCCTFNYYAVNDENQDENEQFQPATPRRVASCGYQTALTVLLNTDPDDYYSAAIASFGMLVFIDSAYNLPDLNSPMRMVSSSTEVFIALSPERTYATSGIKAFSPKERHCYFKDEVKLGNFEDYSYHNCMVYQKATQLKNLCGCLPFYYPPEGSGFSGNLKHLQLMILQLYESRFCNFSDMSCLEQFRLNSEQGLLEKEDFECLPDCEHYDYPLEVALGILAPDVKLDGLTFFKDINLQNRSLLNIFFNDLVTTRYRRDVYLNWQNLLASFGGLLSLMLGFTLISAFDFIIFFTFRLAYDLFRSVSRGGKQKPQPGSDAYRTWLKSNRVYVHEFHQRDNWLMVKKDNVGKTSGGRSVRY